MATRISPFSEFNSVKIFAPLKKKSTKVLVILQVAIYLRSKLLQRNYLLFLILTHMNKSELVNAIAAGAGLSKVDAKKALDATLEAITNAVKAGDKVALLGFGTFSVNERPARQGINPATKQKIQIAAKKVVKFKAGAELAAVVE